MRRDAITNTRAGLIVIVIALLVSGLTYCLLISAASGAAAPHGTRCPENLAEYASIGDGIAWCGHPGTESARTPYKALCWMTDYNLDVSKSRWAVRPCYGGSRALATACGARGAVSLLDVVSTTCASAATVANRWSLTRACLVGDGLGSPTKSNCILERYYCKTAEAVVDGGPIEAIVTCHHRQQWIDFRRAI